MSVCMCVCVVERKSGCTCTESERHRESEDDRQNGVSRGARVGVGTAHVIELLWGCGVVVTDLPGTRVDPEACGLSWAAVAVAVEMPGAPLRPLLTEPPRDSPRSEPDTEPDTGPGG